MKILIIGATRGIGAELLDQALSMENHVTVLARNPAGVERNNDYLRPPGIPYERNANGEVPCLN